MASVEQFLSSLRKHIGVTEWPPGSNNNPFAQPAGHANGRFWCATYVVACARDAGLKLPSESAATITMADAFRRAGRWCHDPQPGDLGFVDFPNHNATKIEHVLVVTAVDGDRVHSIEGNTSSGDDGSQDNGGGVYEKVRPRKWVVGFGRAAFDDQAPTLGHGTIIPDREAEMATIVPRPQGGYIVVQGDGGVFTDGVLAPFKGSVPGTPEIKLGGNVVGGAWTESGEGYWLVAQDGAVYGFGDAVYHGGFNTYPPEVRGSRYAVGMVRTGPSSYRIVTFDPSGDDSRYDHYDYSA
jgi:hypothetical protein